MSYYAVKKGRKPGVYKTQDECKEQVDSYAPDCESSHNSGDVFPSSSEPPEVRLYTDGACSGNPGIGGFGYVVVINGKLTLKGSGGLLSTTNNQMELSAVIEGLKTIPKRYPVTVYSDSLYVVNAFKKHWIDIWQQKGWFKRDGSPVLNRGLWEQLLVQISEHKAVDFVWVKGHAGNQYNEMCDRLAVSAVKGLESSY